MLARDDVQVAERGASRTAESGENMGDIRCVPHCSAQGRRCWRENGEVLDDCKGNMAGKKVVKNSQCR